jgi:hypothetical protein
MARVLFLCTLLASTSVLAQDPNAVTQRDIDQAIRKGAEYLKVAPSTGGWLHPNCDELILLTMIHAGVPETNPKFDEYLRHCLQATLEKTYKVACLAMALEELDAERYQMKIAQCAAFLVDNQASNGQWSYGQPVDVKNYPYVEKEKKVETGVRPGGARDFGGVRERGKKPSRQILVPQTKHTGEKGDNSNSQYASLGLRACHDANIKLPMECLSLARKWWVEAQFPDEGDSAKAGKNAVSSGGDTPRIQGWNYQKPGEGEGGGKPTHPMTAGAVGATVIYEYLMGHDFKKDGVTRAGVNWLGKNFTVNENLYYMYALERAGMLYDTVKFGDHDWYMEGAKLIVHAQKPDGSWGNKQDKPEENTWDTCFAILFLKKATRGVATGDRK